MCFSASASFIAGAALTAAGVASMTQVRKPVHHVFASIPLLFGIQQVCEGFVWLSLSGVDFLGGHAIAKYAFLFFAQVLWPFWIPLAFLIIERSPKRRKIFRYFLFAGIAASVLLTGRLIFSPAVAEIDGCHIAYEIESTKVLFIITAILYLAAIVVAPFFSSWKTGLVMAIVNVVSLTITNLFFEVYLVSVWCFFAAVQSVLVFFVMREIRQKNVSG